MAESTTGNGAATPPPARYARSRYWILPSIQGRFIAWLVAVSAVVATTVSLALLLLVWMPLSHHLAWSNVNVQPEELMGNMVRSVLLTTAILIVFFGLVALAAGIFVSHKVAGPLYRISMVAGQVGQGQMDKRIELRRGDYVRELADKLNSMLDQVENRFRAQQQALENAHRSLTEMEAAVAAGRVTAEEMERGIQDALRTLRTGRTNDLANGKE
jgi:methyl-accepting chemotaxis protein